MKKLIIGILGLFFYLVALNIINSVPVLLFKNRVSKDWIKYQSTKNMSILEMPYINEIEIVNCAGNVIENSSKEEFNKIIKNNNFYLSWEQFPLEENVKIYLIFGYSFLFFDFYPKIYQIC